MEHICLHEELDGQEYVVEFDFLGKDSIRYYNKVSVEKRVFKNLQLFKENKQEGDDLFDRLNVSAVVRHLYVQVGCVKLLMLKLALNIGRVCSKVSAAFCVDLSVIADFGIVSLPLVINQ